MAKPTQITQTKAKVVTLELKQTLRQDIQNLHSVSNALRAGGVNSDIDQSAQENAQAEQVKILAKIPYVGTRAADCLLALAGHLRPGTDAKAQLDKVLLADEHTLGGVRYVGALKAKTVYDALELARLDLLQEKARAALEARFASTEGILGNGADREVVFEDLVDLVHFIRTGKHMERD